MQLTSSRALVVLRISSAFAALLVLVQVLLVVLTAAKAGSLIDVHGAVGYLTLLSMVIATVAAYVWFRRGGSRGLVMHAGGVAVLMVVQIGLGLAKLAVVHVVLGVLIVLGTAALALLAYRKPGGAV